VDGPEPPVLPDQFSGEPVEQFRVGGPGTLQPEVIGGLHQAPAKVMLPESVHDDSGQQMAGPVFVVRDPVRQGASATRELGARRWSPMPALFGVRNTGEHLEKSLGRNAALLVGAAAVQNVGLVEEVRALGVHANRSVALRAGQHLGQLRLGRRAPMGFSGVSQRFPAGIGRFPPIDQHRALSWGE
jgi:hypothetical protein